MERIHEGWNAFPEVEPQSLAISRGFSSPAPASMTSSRRSGSFSVVASSNVGLTSFPPSAGDRSEAVATRFLRWPIRGAEHHSVNFHLIPAGQRRRQADFSVGHQFLFEPMPPTFRSFSQNRSNLRPIYQLVERRPATLGGCKFGQAACGFCTGFWA